ncbi:MAG TPA: GGDEF domain-containing protein [Epulopiscium sp.]|nr:GGDEF domain-containing protein [Candidatus Epulonipiscium sp.]
MKIKTRELFIAGIILTILMITQVIVYGGFFKAMKHDAELINEVGKIRGSIQRLVKIELNNNTHNESRKDIDVLITSYIHNPEIMDYDHGEQINNIKALEQSWRELELLLDDYHLNPIEQTKNLVLIKSEEMWKISNESVLNAQKIAEGNVSYFKYFTVGFILNVLAIIITLFIFKKRIYDELKVSAIHDPLTKAFNRRYFNEYIENEILRGQRKNKVFCLIMLDIDHFKNVNDTYGHNKGDYVLATLVKVVGKIIRRYDVLSRIGGEEFTILLPDTNINDAFDLAERVRMSVEEYPFEGIPPLTISLGVVELKNDDDGASILERADQAMYKAKNSGRNRTEKG